ncbi:MAG: hypothetical protein ACRDT6_19200 [Micromonosporaceae bacterium]
MFGASEPWFHTTAEATDDKDDGDHDDLVLCVHPMLAPNRYDQASHTLVPIERDAETVERHGRCKTLADALETGEFDDVLLDAFGDHAHVRMSRSGIVVDDYEHD